MSKLRSCVLAALAAGLPALAPLAASAATPKDCKAFAAVGSGLSESVATLMAKQGAVNVAEGRGYSVQGEAKLVSCASGGIFGTECTAKTYACKMPK
jgi:hypothetical protein